MAARDPDLQARIAAFVTTLALTATPFDRWLADRGLHFFELRYDRAGANTAALADAIADLPGVTEVIYPGRADHPDRARAERLLRGRNGNMVAFHIDGERAAANALVRAAGNTAFAPKLGDIGTTLSRPATSSHGALSADGRARLGLHEGSFRVSVGVEPVELLISEFEAAIDAAQRAG